MLMSMYLKRETFSLTFRMLGVLRGDAISRVALGEKCPLPCLLEGTAHMPRSKDRCSTVSQCAGTCARKGYADPTEVAKDKDTAAVSGRGQRVREGPGGGAWKKLVALRGIAGGHSRCVVPWVACSVTPLQV